MTTCTFHWVNAWPLALTLCTAANIIAIILMYSCSASLQLQDTAKSLSFRPGCLNSRIILTWHHHVTSCAQMVNLKQYNVLLFSKPAKLHAKLQLQHIAGVHDTGWFYNPHDILKIIQNLAVIHFIFMIICLGGGGHEFVRIFDLLNLFAYCLILILTCAW